MHIIQKHKFLILATIVFLGIRVFTSDPWTGAVATNDTGSYVITAESSIFSTAFYSGPRPITIPLLYKIFTPLQGYDTSVRSEPSIGKHPGLKDLPGFSNVALIQSLISVFSWWLLAFALYRRLHNPWLRGLSITLLLLSACLPEIASWDHVMMAESLTYSLFALLLALSLFLFDLSFFAGLPASRSKKWLTAGFLITMFLWVNARDTNVYFLAVSILCLTIGLLIPLIRRSFHQIPRLGGIILIAFCGIYGLQQVTARASIRLINPIINNLTANVFPYSTRVQFMHEKWGMPDSQDIISNTSSANYSDIRQNKEFVDWVQQKGMSAYMDFMIHTPLWTTQMLIDSVSENFGYYKQPYFDPLTVKPVLNINQLSRLVNWSSSDLILISLFLILAATGKNLIENDAAKWPEIGLLICLWLGAGLMYSASYLGETWGSAPRHIQNVILTYRLIILIFVPLQFDSIGDGQHNVKQTP